MRQRAPGEGARKKSRLKNIYSEFPGENFNLDKSIFLKKLFWETSEMYCRSPGQSSLYAALSRSVH